MYLYNEYNYVFLIEYMYFYKNGNEKYNKM